MANFALVDASNFYVSCESEFRPSLRGRPVVVLSSNDGAVIARSEEAKALGIKMGEPWFNVKHFEASSGLVAMSANFILYADISTRLMSLISGLGYKTEIYSVDEAFCALDGIHGNLTERAFKIRARIQQWLGIKCGVGIGESKTLAKLANFVSKQAERKPGSYPSHFSGVCNFTALSEAEKIEVLQRTLVGDVWGVGRRLSVQLAEVGVVTALNLSMMDPATVRRRWGVVLERTVRELRGESCIALEDAPSPKQQIAVTRSFGQPVMELADVLNAVSEFASRAAEKLRKQDSFASQVYVFAHTSPFRPPPQFSRGVVVPLRRPTSDTSLLIAAARAGVQSFYEEGYELKKAGVILLDVVSNAAQQTELDLGDDAIGDRSALMSTIDRLNQRYGRGTVFVGGTEASATKVWAPRQSRLTPQYTTKLSDIPVAHA